MVVPPLSRGAAQERLIAPATPRVATTLAGESPGTVAGVAVSVLLEVHCPTLFTAETLKS